MAHRLGRLAGLCSFALAVGLIAGCSRWSAAVSRKCEETVSMRKIQLSRSDYYDKMFACWLGKNIGGTLGAPFEGRKQVNNLTFFTPVPSGPAANDDLDFQIVWLKMLEDKKTEPTLSDFAEYWHKYLLAYPWNEYGFCQRNLERGLMPPISGCFENYFVDEMGSPIRSEIWACIAPGDPQLAAALAWTDSALDHAGGEGTYGEMFWAAVESAAFVEKDPETLIRIGLAMIPVPCAISRVIREAVWCSENGVPWADARERIATIYGHHQPCNAIPNHGFIILGWLYGTEFGDKLCKAVNCGFDTDCTGATLGSLLGIIGGTPGIPDAWRKPVGEDIVLHKYTGAFNSPKTVKELTDRVQVVAEKFVPRYSDVAEFADRTSLPDDLLSSLFRNDKAIEMLRKDVQSAIVNSGGYEITFHYNGEPVLRPNIQRTFAVSIEKQGHPLDAQVAVKVPQGWTVSTCQQGTGHHNITVLASQVPDRNTITITAQLPDGNRSFDFTILGPGEAKGFPSGANVPTCPKCGARVSACMCVPP